VSASAGSAVAVPRSDRVRTPLPSAAPALYVTLALMKTVEARARRGPDRQRAGTGHRHASVATRVRPRAASHDAPILATPPDAPLFRVVDHWMMARPGPKPRRSTRHGRAAPPACPFVWGRAARAWTGGGFGSGVIFACA
jgi:hypothetical protein